MEEVCRKDLKCDVSGVGHQVVLKLVKKSYTFHKNSCYHLLFLSLIVFLMHAIIKWLFHMFSIYSNICFSSNILLYSVPSSF